MDIALYRDKRSVADTSPAGDAAREDYQDKGETVVWIIQIY